MVYCLSDDDETLTPNDMESKMKKPMLVAKGHVVEFFAKGEREVAKVAKVTEKMVFLDGGKRKRREDVKVLF